MTAIPELGPVCPYADMYQEAGELYGIDGWLLAAIGRRESTHTPDASGASGELGLCQFMPETWKEWGHGDPTEPNGSIDAAARYLVWLREQCEDADKWGLRWVLAAYNWGVGRVLETEHYSQVPEKVKAYVIDVGGYHWGYLKAHRKSVLSADYGFGAVSVPTSEGGR